MEGAFMLTDMQFKDSLRKDRVFNELLIALLESGDVEKALEYLEKDNDRIDETLAE